MPWTVEDVEKHKSGLSAKQKKQWVGIANSARQKCIDDGGESDKCDIQAIKIANGSMKESMNGDEMSMDDIRKCLSDELHKSDPQGEYTYIEDIWEDELVYSRDGQSYKCSYVIDGQGVITMGTPKKVVRKTTYEPTESEKSKWVESNSVITGEAIKLIENVQGKDDDLVPIKIIQSGWGSSGYYPEAMLKRDGPKVFKKGLHMYWDHPTQSEESERPERSLRDLAGVLASDAEWKDSGIYGAGLYASAKVIQTFKDAVKELAPNIGTSIRASGIAEDGEADGRKGKIIEEITDAMSVDFVTLPGAGGKVLEIFESYRNPDSIERKNKMDEIVKLKETISDLEGKVQKAEADLKTAKDELEKAKSEITTKDGELASAKAEIAKQSEALLLKQVVTFIEGKLADIVLPDPTKQRLVEKLSLSPVLTEDKKLDEVKFGEVIEKAVESEKDYLVKVVGSGKIQGMGESSSPEGKSSLLESFTELYVKQGHSLEEAKRMAEYSAGV